MHRDVGMPCAPAPFWLATAFLNMRTYAVSVRGSPMALAGHAGAAFPSSIDPSGRLLRAVDVAVPAGLDAVRGLIFAVLTLTPR